MSALKPPAPVFLARTGYRLRRLMDAARVLPLAGAFLFLLPLLWGGGATRRAVLFVFAVWLGLIVVAAMLSRPLGRVDARPEPEDHSGGDAGT